MAQRSTSLATHSFDRCVFLNLCSDIFQINLLRLLRGPLFFLQVGVSLQSAIGHYGYTKNKIIRFLNFDILSSI
jgi:hypothetical protein